MLIKELEKRTGAKILNKVVSKNNGVHLDSITIQREERRVSPNIYLESFWNNFQYGEKLDSIVERMMTIDSENQDVGFDRVLNSFMCFDAIKCRISYKLVNYEKNAEILQKVPHREYLDLAIVYQVVIAEKEIGLATILVNNNHVSMWNVTETDLFQVAHANTEKLMPAKLKDMDELMHEMGMICDLSSEELEKMIGGVVPMYVLTNEYRNFGAACILYDGMLEAIYHKLGQSYYILPSSIHECVIVPEIDNDADELKSLVKETNLTQVSDDEYLADSVYKYEFGNELKEM